MRSAIQFLLLAAASRREEIKNEQKGIREHERLVGRVSILLTNFPFSCFIGLSRLLDAAVKADNWGIGYNERLKIDMSRR